jgi:hypothetical protein
MPETTIANSCAPASKDGHLALKNAASEQPILTVTARLMQGP